MRSRAPTFTETARRVQIVGCAVEVIAEMGFAHASVRKIAERADVAMSVVMYHFGSKSALVAAVVSECYRSLLEVMVPAVETESTAAGKLTAHIRAHMSYVESHRSHQVALMEIASDFRGTAGERLSDLEVDAQHVDALATVELDDIFRLGAETGEFRSLSPSSMALAVRSAIGGAVLASTRDPKFDVAGYGEDLVDAFLRASAADG